MGLASAASASAAPTTAAARGETKKTETEKAAAHGGMKKTERGFFSFPAGLCGGVFLLCALIAGTFVITRSLIGNSSSISSAAMVYGSKGDKQKQDDNFCPALLPMSMSNDCGATGERETILSVAYSYSFITNKDDAIDDVISCNEAKVHQALVRDMCPRAQETQATKSKKIGNRKEKVSRIVVNIESLPTDIADGPCPDDTLDLEQRGDDETCQTVTGGLTLTLALAKALELEENQVRRLGSNDESERDDIETRMGSSSISGSSGIKDGMRRLQEEEDLTEKEAKKVRKELEKLMKNLMKEMNRSLVLGLSKKELKEQQEIAKESINQLTIEDLQKLISGEYKVDVDYTEGDGFTFSFVPATESPSPSCAGTNTVFGGVWTFTKYFCFQINLITTDFIENEVIGTVSVGAPGTDPVPAFTLVLANCSSSTEITVCDFDGSSCDNIEYSNSNDAIIGTIGTGTDATREDFSRGGCI